MRMDAPTPLWDRFPEHGVKTSTLLKYFELAGNASLDGLSVQSADGLPDPESLRSCNRGIDVTWGDSGIGHFPPIP